MSRVDKRLIVDFDDDLPEGLGDVDSGAFSLVIVRFRYRYIGSSNSYLDVSVDLVEASWVVELLGAHARQVRFWETKGSHPTLTVALRGIFRGLEQALQDAVLLWNDSDDEEGDEEVERLQAIRARVNEYEDHIHELDLRVPGLAGGYLANLITSYGESHSEAPEFMREQYAQFPERRLDYFLSPSSRRFGGACYSSREGWILDRSVDINRFFALTNQSYRKDEFRPAQIVSLGPDSVAVAQEVLSA